LLINELRKNLYQNPKKLINHYFHNEYKTMLDEMMKFDFHYHY